MQPRAIVPLLSLLVLAVWTGAEPVIVPIHPGSGEFITPDELMVVATIAGAEADLLSRAELEVRIDGIVQPGAELVSGSTVQLMLDHGSFDFGSHTVEVVLKDTDTDRATASWSFTLLDPAPQALARDTSRRIRHNGRVFAEAGHYTLDGETDWEFRLGGAYRASYGTLRYGAELLLSNLNDATTQDRNVYRADIAYRRSLFLKVGDTRPTMNPAILSGQRIRGLYAGAHAFLRNGLNIANLDIAWGQARRAAEPDTYERSIFAARASVGSGRTFQFGLTFLKGRDDTASISPTVDSLLLIDSISTVGDTAFDTTLVEGQTPEDNLVIGADVVLRLLDRRLQLYGSYAFSLYTRDIGDTTALTASHLDSAFGEGMGFDPELLGNLMVLNTSSLPLQSGRGILNSSYIEAGLKLHLPFNVLTEDFTFEYALQGPNYHTMGNTLMGTGEQGFTITDRVYLLQNRLLVNASYGRYWNNLDELQPNGTVSNRFSAGFSLFYSPKAPSLTLSYNYNAAANDDTTYGFANGVNLFNLVSAYNYRLGKLSGVVQAFAAFTGISNEWQQTAFDDTATVTSTDTSATFSTGIYGINIQASIDDAPLRVSGGLSTNAGSEELLRLVTGTFNGHVTFIPDMLVAHAGVHMGGSRMPEDTDYAFHLRFPFGADLTPWKNHHASWKGYMVVDGADFDIVNSLRYEWRF